MDPFSLCVFTWDGREKLDSIPVTMETELSVRHGAVWNKSPCGNFVSAVVTVDTHYTSRTVSCSFGCFFGR